MKRRRVSFTQEGMEKYEKSLYKTPFQPRIPGSKYAWVYGITPKGKHVCDGPFPVSYGTEIAPDEAEASLAEFPAGEIFILKTRNMAEAKKQIKHTLLTRGGGPDEALERMLKKVRT